VLYGVGLLVTNGYLLSAGVTDFNPFRIRCVLTGAWATPFLLSMFLPAALMLRTLSDENRKKGDPSTVIAICCFFSMFTWILGLSVGIIPTIKMVFLYFSGIMLFFAPALGYVTLYYVKKHDKRPGIKPGPPNTFHFFILMCICLVIASAALGKIAYPQVFPAFGGGRPFDLSVLFWSVQESVASFVPCLLSG
jgi:hypothetical protein